MMAGRVSRTGSILSDNGVEVISQGPRMSFSPVAASTDNNKNGVRLAQHMTIAGSFLDFALFVADVEHLKFILDAGKNNVNYYILLIMLLVGSLILQLVVVVLLFIVGFKNNTIKVPSTQKDFNEELEEIKAKKEYSILNHVIICLVTIIAILNVFITVFGDRMTSMINKMHSDFSHRNHSMYKIS